MILGVNSINLSVFIDDIAFKTKTQNTALWFLVIGNLKKTWKLLCFVLAPKLLVDNVYSVLKSWTLILCLVCSLAVCEFR